LIMNFVCIPSIQAGSRTVWAFARDGMLPASNVWYRIWKRTDTPVLAVWLYSVLCILINLIGLGSYITIAAIFNTCAIALNWSYCIPIICKLLYGRFERGPWHLGPLSVSVNVCTCIWNAFMSVIFLFPTVRPVKPDNVRFRPPEVTPVLLPFLFCEKGNNESAPKMETKLKKPIDELCYRHPCLRLTLRHRLLGHQRAVLLYRPSHPPPHYQ
jgi:amino acid transporter